MLFDFFDCAFLLTKLSAFDQNKLKYDEAKIKSEQNEKSKDNRIFVSDRI